MGDKPRAKWHTRISWQQIKRATGQHTANMYYFYCVQILEPYAYPVEESAARAIMW